MNGQSVDLNLWEVIPIATYLIFLLVVGFRKGTGNTSAEQFMLGGRRLTLPAFVATLVSTWYGGILGVGEFTYLYGISNWVVFGLPYYFFALLFAWMLAGKIQQNPAMSIPELFKRSGSEPAGSIAAIYILFITLPAPYILMVGFFIQMIVGCPLWLCIVLSAIFSLMYVFAGGFRAVVRTDKLQFALMFAGFFCLLIFLAWNYDLSPLQSDLPASHWQWDGGNSATFIVSWFFIAAWTFVDPGFHQRCAAAKSPHVARKGIFISVSFWLLFDMMTTFCGLYAVVLLPDILPQMAFPLLGHQELPPLLSGFFLTGLLATIMSTVDSLLLLSAITIGYDLLGKSSGRGGRPVIRLSLVISTVLSVVLAILVPSVIKLWFYIGNLFIPPLLMPVIGRLTGRLAFSPNLNLIHLVIVFLVTVFWWSWGIFMSGDMQIPQYPLGLEPVFPGLLTSALIYLASLILPGKNY